MSFGFCYFTLAMTQHYQLRRLLVSTDMRQLIRSLPDPNTTSVHVLRRHSPRYERLRYCCQRSSTPTHSPQDRYMRVTTFFIIAISLGVTALIERRPHRTCEQGPLLGTVQRTISGRSIDAFLGIPYAEAPVGELRFKKPAPPKPWLGTLIVSSLPNVCIQFNRASSRKATGSEDCLYLNVYVPKITEGRDHRSELLDVMVYIHGGAYQMGSANHHGPDYLLDEEDVILVTVNYRLGLLGFLSLQDEVLPGNMGLKDQTMALQWVKRNIAYFGGDPNKVTISGCSSGAASVHAHILSPISKGLFQRAIIASGVTLNPWAFDTNPRPKILLVANTLGCPTNESQMIVDCLVQRPAEDIVAQAELFLGRLEYDGSPVIPVIEKPSFGAFLDKYPEEIIQSGEASDVPLLMSYMNDEALFITAEILSNSTIVREFEENWSDRIWFMDSVNVAVDDRRTMAQEIRKFYLGEKNILEDPAKFTQLFSDWCFIVGIQKAAKLHAQRYQSPVYAYVFSYVGGERYSDYYNLTGIYNGGACHGDDTYYVIRTDYLKKRMGDQKEDAMSKTMIRVWMDFIRGAMPSNWKPVEGLQSFTYKEIVSANASKNPIRYNRDTSVEDFWKKMEEYEYERKSNREEL